MKKVFYFSFFASVLVIFSFALVSGAQAATGLLVDPTITATSVYGGRTVNYTVSFQNQSSTEVGTQIELIFPSGFNISGATATSGMTASTSGSSIVASSTVSGQSLTLWLADGSVTAASETIEVSGIPNIQSPYAGGSQAFGIMTRTQAGDEIDDGSSTVAFTASPKTIIDTPSASDTTAPTSLVTTPSAATSISGGVEYVLKGLSNDSGGSYVQKVEVSVDGGATWLTAERDGDISYTGSYKWKYAWQNPAAGDYTIKVRATDSKGNRETPSAGVSITVSGAVTPLLEADTLSPTPAPESGEAGTVEALQAQITTLQQTVLGLLQQLVQLLTAQLSTM